MVVFVNKIDVASNTIRVGNREEALASTFVVDECNWLLPREQMLRESLKVQIRYNHSAKPARLSLLENEAIQVSFEEPEHAITPGQSAVFFWNDAVVGGGIIKSV